MSLPHSKINATWKSGFCAEAVEFVKTTAAEDSQARIDFMAQHAKTCRCCCFANALKSAEGELAQRMGMSKQFSRGEDTYTDSAPTALRLEILYKYLSPLGLILENGEYNPELSQWLVEVHRRGDYEEDTKLRGRWLKATSGGGKSSGPKK